MSKVRADDHIFVKLAFNPNNKAPKQSLKPDNSIDNLKIGSNVTFGNDADKNRLGVNYMYANSSKESRQIEKRERNIYKKLYYLNSSRILQIVGYAPNQADERKFLFSNYKEFIMEKTQPLDSKIPGTPQVDLMKQASTIKKSTPSAVPVQNTFLNELQNKVFEL